MPLPINSGNEKSLVENLVDWSRRNMMVPVPRVESINELNDLLLEGCLKYRQHQTQGRSQTVGQQAEADCHTLTKLPAYLFDTSRTATPRVYDGDAVQFERNRYSVPVKLVDCQISIKAYGNNIDFYHKAEKSLPTSSATSGEKPCTYWNTTCPCWNKNPGPFTTQSLCADPKQLPSLIGGGPFPTTPKTP